MQDMCQRVIIDFLKRAQAKYKYAKTGFLGAHVESLLISVDLRTILLLMRDMKKKDFDRIAEAWCQGDPAPLLLQVRFLFCIIQPKATDMISDIYRSSIGNARGLIAGETPGCSNHSMSLC